MAKRMQRQFLTYELYRSWYGTMFDGTEHMLSLEAWESSPFRDTRYSCNPRPCAVCGTGECLNIPLACEHPAEARVFDHEKDEERCQCGHVLGYRLEMTA